MFRKFALALFSIFLVGCAHGDPYKKLDELYAQILNKNKNLDKFLDDNFSRTFGQVIYEDGTPVQSAMVSVFVNGVWREFAKESDFTDERGYFMVRFQSGKEPIVVATLLGHDSLGHLSVENAAYYHVLRDRPRSGTIVLKMYRNGPSSVKGRIKNIYSADEYRPINADISYVDFNNFILKSNSLGKDGNFIFENLQPGKYFFRVFSVCDMFSTELDLKPGENIINPELITDKVCVEQMNKEAEEFRKRHQVKE